MARLPRTATAATLAALATVAAAGCGSPTDSTPAACLNGPAAYERALAAAPGRAELRGDVPISACLAENQKAGDLTRAGESMVVVATRLNREGRDQPHGSAALRLGYLVGAAQRGAADTGGIHADLMRRLTSAAGLSAADEPVPPAFRRAYRRGVEAGRARG